MTKRKYIITDSNMTYDGNTDSPDSYTDSTDSYTDSTDSYTDSPTKLYLKFEDLVGHVDHSRFRDKLS